MRSAPTANVGLDVEAVGGSDEKENESLVEARDFLQAWLRVDNEASKIRKRTAPASKMRHKTHAVAIVRNSTSHKRKIQAKEQKQESEQIKDICNQESRPPKCKITSEHDPRIAMQQRHAAVQQLRAQRIRRQLAREQERKQEHERKQEKKWKCKGQSRQKQGSSRIEHQQQVSRQNLKDDVRTSLQDPPGPLVRKEADGARRTKDTTSGMENCKITRSHTDHNDNTSLRCRAELLRLNERLAAERSELHAIEQCVEQEREARQSHRLRSEIQRVRERQRELRREQQQARIEANEHARLKACRLKRAAARLLLRLAEVERRILFNAARRRMQQWRTHCEREQRQTRALLRRVFSGWVTEWNSTRERIRRAHETYVWRTLSSHFVALRSYALVRRRERENLAWKRQLRADREAEQKARSHASIRLKRSFFAMWRGVVAQTVIRRREERLQRAMHNRVEMRLRALATPLITLLSPTA